MIMSSRGDRKRERRHFNRLVSSQPDDIALATAVEDKFLTLSKEWLRIRGEELPIPSYLDSDLLRWRTLRVRHKQGDFRHTEAEKKSTKAVAQFTVDYYRILKNQPPEKIQWSD